MRRMFLLVPAMAALAVAATPDCSCAGYHSGRHKIASILEIAKSGVVLRGEGPEKTTLFFPTPLNDISPNWGATTTRDRTSNYSWSGGFVWIGKA